jgi:hypothetical protein
MRLTPWRFGVTNDESNRKGSFGEPFGPKGRDFGEAAQAATQAQDETSTLDVNVAAVAWALGPGLKVKKENSRENLKN